MTSDRSDVYLPFRTTSVVLVAAVFVSMLQVARGQGIAGAEGSRAALLQFRPAGCFRRHEVLRVA